STRGGPGRACTGTGRRAAQPVAITSAATTSATRYPAMMAQEYRRGAPGDAMRNRAPLTFFAGHFAVPSVKPDVMSRPAVALLVAVALAAPAVHAQTPDPPRAFLLFIDDLHLDFRQTPRTRALMQRLLRDVARDTDVWSVVTTGTSSVNVSPTTDVTAINAAVSRVTGNGLKPSERVPATPGSSALELQRRASVSFATATRAIETIAAAAPRASLTVLYVSDGYDASVVPAMSP